MKIIALDFFNIGKYALDHDDPQHAKSWLTEAKNQLERENKNSIINGVCKSEIFKTLASADALLRELDTARRVFSKIQKKFKSYTEVKSMELAIKGGMYKITNGSIGRKSVIHNWVSTNRWQNGSFSNSWLHRCVLQKVYLNH